MIGRTLGGFRIIEQIGIGGMATVFKAYDAAADRYVAIKTLPQQHSADPSFRSRFEQEAKAIAKLEHIHILPIFAYGEEDGIAYMAMRYLETGTLKELIATKNLTVDEIATITKQIAHALDYAHSQNIIHRDIKPSNILIDKHGNILLSDFGIAKIVESSLDLTGTGIVGTPHYMSPEQFMDSSKISPASDQYSLAVMVYEMLTGRTPYQAETPMAIMQQQLQNAPFPPPSSLSQNLPDSAEAVLLKALSQNPQERYPTCSHFAEAFSQALHQTTSRSPVDAPQKRVMVKSDMDGATQMLKPQLPQSAANPRLLWFLLIFIMAIIAFAWRFYSDNSATTLPELTASAEASEAVAVITASNTPRPSRIPASATVRPSPTYAPRPAASGISLFDDFTGLIGNVSLDRLQFPAVGENCRFAGLDAVLSVQQGDCFLDVGTAHASGDTSAIRADLQLNLAPDAEDTLGASLILYHDGGEWDAVCGIGKRDGSLYNYFYISSQDSIIYESETNLSENRWYTLELQVDFDTGTFFCRRNADFLGTYTIQNQAALRDNPRFNQQLSFHAPSFVDNLWSSSSAGFGYIDSPSAGESLSGWVVVEGWVLLNTDIETIVVVLNGEIVSTARYGLIREDVANDYSTIPLAAQSGYSASINTHNFPNGDYTLEVWVIGVDGTRFPLYPNALNISIEN